MPNRLARETSPYLQQHADNPVDWYAWGEEALAAARASGKPILLSVGYSACHWCHVMAHESFEDPAIARLMNEMFVNIKVDREERPDIDQIYQLAQQMLTQRTGGWPLTMFLTPDQVPFFGGTYFPNPARYGMAGFEEILKRVRQYYEEHREDIREHGGALLDAFQRMAPRAQPGVVASADLLDEAASDLEQAFDRENGGFTGAPKFPHCETIELSLRRYAASGERASLDRALLTLTHMAMGGIYDHVGGGFARYSVDAHWTIPHFEKMLYDNAWLLRVYADAWAITRDPLFERVVRETADWVMREMQAPEGGYYSSIDADSEGEEGKYYVWDVAEIRALLTPEEFAAVSALFGLDAAPNFEGHHWHLTMRASAEQVAHMLSIDEGTLEVLVDSARAKLFAAREKRVRPGLDDKVLTSWNALMIAGMAHAGRVFGQEEWLSSARRALDFARASLWQDGRLLATYKDGRAHLGAYLDDHAYLLAALIEMAQADFRAQDLDWAVALANALLERFEDRDAGGFFFTAHDHEALIHRPKPGPDNATPSGNGVAALSLNRLAFITGDTRYEAAARRVVALFTPQMQRQPSAFGTLLMALEEQLEPVRTVILRAGASDARPWRDLLDREYLPSTVALTLAPTLKALPETLDKPALEKAAAYLCEGATCLAPITDPAQLRSALGVEKMRPIARPASRSQGVSP